MMFASMYSTRSHQQKVCTVNVIWTDHKYFYQVFKAIQVIPLAQIFLTIYIPVHGWAGYISYHPFKKKKSPRCSNISMPGKACYIKSSLSEMGLKIEWMRWDSWTFTIDVPLPPVNVTQNLVRLAR